MMTTLRGGATGFPFFLPMLPKLRTCEPVTSPNACDRAFFERASEALSSRTSRPDSRPTSVAVVVLPMPGGPLRRAAFHGPLGPLRLLTGRLGLLNTFSQLLSHRFSLLTLSALPKISPVAAGAYLPHP